MIFLVGFAMTEIVYFWLGEIAAVDVSPDVQLPQFRLVGYRQRYQIIQLTTGGWQISIISDQVQIGQTDKLEMWQ